MRFNLVLLFLFMGVAGKNLTLRAQSSDSFAPTGNLTTERTMHTATLLTNGKVLIAGGFAIGNRIPGVWSSAELYDPSTRTFTATGHMTTSRYGHTATLLPNGKVLISGGSSSINPGLGFFADLRSAELYDPSTGAFTTTGEMTAFRMSHSATLLNDGKVLIAGGNRNQPVASAELYDPDAGAFTLTGEMIAPQGNLKATLLSNGKVLIEAGYGSGIDIDSTGLNQLYDPATGTFSTTGTKAYPDRFPVTASLLTNGKVLVTAQYACDGGEFAELYDPSTETSTATGNMTTPRGYSTSTLLPDGKVLVAGRDWVSWPEAGSVDVYDLVTGKFSPVGGFTDREEGFTSTLLPDGTVLMSGGWRCCGYSLATAVIYRPEVLVSSPVLFSFSQEGQGAILHAGTNRVVSPDDPAVAGEVLEIYGAGLTDRSVIPPLVAIGGRMAEVLFFGDAPGLTGVNQVKVRVPVGIEPGENVPVRLNYLARPSNEVTIGVK